MRYVTTFASMVGLALFAVGCGGGDTGAPTVSSTSSAGGPPSSGYGGGGYGGYGNTGYADAGSGDTTQTDSEQSGATGDSASASDGYGYGATSTANDGGAAAQTGPAGSYPYGTYAAGSGYPPSGYGQTSGLVSFQQQIQPILQRRCLGCHAPGPQQGPRARTELRLHTAEAIMASGVVTAGQPERSELLSRISAPAGSEEIMPPRGEPLTADEIELIRLWIQQGANFGNDGYAGYSGGATDASAGPYGVEPPQPEPPKTLDGKAHLAFQEGRDQEAMLFMFAHAVADPENGAAVLEKYRWARGLKRAVLALRWGLGIEYTVKGRFDADPMPIGRDQDLPDGRQSREGRTRVAGQDAYGQAGGSAGRGAGNQRMAGGEGFDATARTPRETLDYYTGEVGSRVLEELQSRIARSYYGDLLKQAAAQGPASSQDELADGQFSAGGAGYAAYGEGPAAGIGRGGRPTDGYGDDLGANRDRDEATAGIGQLVPGVTMLGLGNRNELFAKARQQDLDALLIFVVDVERNARNGMVYNNTKLRLFDVAKDEQLAGTRLLNNYKIQVARQKDEDDDTVAIEIERFFATADEHFRCIDLPEQIQSHHVVGHASRLQPRQEENPLETLAEIRYWHWKKLLPDDQLAVNFGRIVGTENGTKLAQGSADERKAIIDKWLPSGAAELTTSAPLADERPFR
jgi:hypothetical protein